MCIGVGSEAERNAVILIRFEGKKFFTAFKVIACYRDHDTDSFDRYEICGIINAVERHTSIRFFSWKNQFERLVGVGGYCVYAHYRHRIIPCVRIGHEAAYIGHVAGGRHGEGRPHGSRRRHESLDRAGKAAFC